MEYLSVYRAYDATSFGVEKDFQEEDFVTGVRRLFKNILFLTHDSK